MLASKIISGALFPIVAVDVFINCFVKMYLYICSRLHPSKLMTPIAPKCQPRRSLMISLFCYLVEIVVQKLSSRTFLKKIFSRLYQPPKSKNWRRSSLALWSFHRSLWVMWMSSMKKTWWLSSGGYNSVLDPLTSLFSNIVCSFLPVVRFEPPKRSYRLCLIGMSFS